MYPAEFHDSQLFVKLRTELIARYNEPHRYYHNIFHINDMLNITMGCRVRNRGIVNLIVWYHDAIYDPTRNDNEERSTELAIEQLKNHLSVNDIDYISAGILFTKHQFSSSLAVDDISVVIDADLHILGHDWCYTGYARAIRKEYSHVNDVDYIAGRSKFLTGMLNKKSIYGGFENLNEKAKKNMRLELNYLNKNLFI